MPTYDVMAVDAPDIWSEATYQLPFSPERLFQNASLAWPFQPGTFTSRRLDPTLSNFSDQCFMVSASSVSACTSPGMSSLGSFVDPSAAATASPVPTLLALIRLDGVRRVAD